MPKIEINTPSGYYYCITSSNPDLLGQWFAEVINKEGPNYQPYDQFMLRIWPLFTADGARGTPDWCTKAAHGECHDMTFPGTLDHLISTLIDLREKQHKR